jgi:hypothetical protein
MELDPEVYSWSSDFRQSSLAQPPTGLLVSSPHRGAELISVSEAFPNYYPKDIHNRGPSSIIILSASYHPMAHLYGWCFNTQSPAVKSAQQHVKYDSPERAYLISSFAD